MIEVSSTLRGIEHTTRSDELVMMKVNGRSEMLPANPFKVVAILAERRRKSPAAKARAKLAADAKARGIG
jgi:hypothetical protein